LGWSVDQFYFYRFKKDKGNWNLFLFKDARLLLRTWRDENMRKSQDILELWENIVCSSINKLGDESKKKTFSFSVLNRVIHLRYFLCLRVAGLWTSLCSRFRLPQHSCCICKFWNEINSFLIFKASLQCIRHQLYAFFVLCNKQTPSWCPIHFILFKNITRS